MLAGAAPREPGGIGDYNTGMQMLGGVFAALYDRTRTGRGQLVDASLMRAVRVGPAQQAIRSTSDDVRLTDWQPCDVSTGSMVDGSAAGQSDGGQRLRDNGGIGWEPQ
jgi:hypothetical protein